MSEKVFVMDLGNGEVKAMCDSNEFTVIAPSYIARESSTGTSNVTKLTTNDGVAVFSSNIDKDNNYIFGENIKSAVYDSEDLLPTSGHQNRYSNLAFRLMAEFTMAELASVYPETTMDVVVVTGMPSNEIGTPDEKTLHDFLMGTHVVVRNGKEYVIKVVEVRILQQTLGGVLNKYINDKLQIHKNAKGTVVVFDFGAGTTLLDTYKNLSRVGSKSQTIQIGQNNVYAEILDSVYGKGNYKGLNESHIAESFKDKFIVRVNRDANFSCEAEAKQVIDKFTSDMVSKFNSKIGDRTEIDDFMMQGGGAVQCGAAFKKKFNQEGIIEFENPQLANLQGYFKFGRLVAKQRAQK